MYQEVEIYVPNRKVAVVGAGYIAVELAGILNALGSKVSTLIRYDKVFTCIHLTDLFTRGLFRANETNYDKSFSIFILCGSLVINQEQHSCL